MKLWNMLVLAVGLLCGHGGPADVPAAKAPAKSRTPGEAKARRKAYRRRKAAKAARRRNRR